MFLGQQHVSSSSSRLCFFHKSHFSTNVVLLQRAREDESNDSLFGIVDIRTIRKQWIIKKIRKLDTYEPSDIIRVSISSWNDITHYYILLYLKFSFDILIITLSCFHYELIISLQNFFTFIYFVLFFVGDPYLLYNYYPHDCVHSPGGALHCQVEHHMRDKKKIIFSKLHHQNGSTFIKFFSMSRYTRYLLHTKNS